MNFNKIGWKSIVLHSDMGRILLQLTLISILLGCNNSKEVTQKVYKYEVGKLFVKEVYSQLEVPGTQNENSEVFLTIKLIENKIKVDSVQIFYQEFNRMYLGSIQPKLNEIRLNLGDKNKAYANPANAVLDSLQIYYSHSQLNYLQTEINIQQKAPIYLP